MMKRYARLLSGLLVAGVVLATWMVVINDAAGFRARVVLSDSMNPAIRSGSVIVAWQRPAASYKEGDVVLFRAPITSRPEIVHRIVRFFPNRYGLEVAATKGDHNTNGDPWAITRGNILGKVILTVPYAGYPVQLVRTSLAGFMVLAVLLFFLWVYPVWTNRDYPVPPRP